MNAEILKIKKQLLDAKNTIAELSDENKALQDTIVSLQTQLYEYGEKNRELENLNAGFEKQLALEKRKAVVEDGEKLDELLIKLKETEDALSNRNLNNKYLEGLVELRDGQLKETETRLQELMSKVSGGAEDVNVIEMFRKENREKKILHEKIMELTEELNGVRNVCNAVAAENCQLKETYKVPASYGLNLRDFDLANAIFKENFKAKIAQLEGEVECLEAERASLKHNLRQMSMMVNINSRENPLFADLSDEKILAIETYALNIREDRAELPLNDRSKALQKQIEYLEAQISFLKEKETIHTEEVLDLLRAIQAQGLAPHNATSHPLISRVVDSNSVYGQSLDRKLIRSMRVQNESVKRSARNLLGSAHSNSDNNFSHVAHTVRSVHAREHGGSEVGRERESEDKEADYAEVLEDIIQLDDIEAVKHVLMKTYAEMERVHKERDFFEGKYRALLEQADKEAGEQEGHAHALARAENEFSRQRDELSVSIEAYKRKVRLLETKTVNYERLINEHMREDPNVQLIIENATMEDENINVARENALLARSVEHAQKSLQIEKEAFFAAKSRFIQRIAHSETLLAENRALIEQLSLGSLNTVSMMEHRELLFRFRQLEDKYGRAKLEALKTSELVDSLTQAQRENLALGNRLAAVNAAQVNLGVQYKLLDHLCRHMDEEYRYFANLSATLCEKLSAQPAGDVEGELNGILADNLSKNLVDQRFVSIFANYGVQLSTYDVNVIKRYMCVQPAGKLDLAAFARHLRVYNAHGDKRIEAVSVRFKGLLDAFDAVESSPAELFAYLDVAGSQRLYMQDVSAGLQKMGQKVERFDLRLFFNTYAMSEEDYFTREEFLSACKQMRADAAVELFIAKTELSAELRVAAEINHFLATNKLGLKSALDVLGLYDSGDKGYLNASDLRALLNEKMGKSVPLGEVHKLALFISRRTDQRIYLSDFEAFLSQAKALTDTNALLQSSPKLLKRECSEDVAVALAHTAEGYRQNAIEAGNASSRQVLERLHMTVKQQKETIEFLDKSLSAAEEGYKKLNKEHKVLVGKYLADKAERDRAVNEAAQSIHAADDSRAAAELQSEREINKILSEEVDALRLSSARCEDELSQLRKLAIREAGADSARSNELRLMMQFLNGKYEEGEYKRTIEKCKGEISELQCKVEALETKLHEHEQRRHELGIFLIRQVNALQEELARLNVNELSTFDVADFDKLARSLDELNAAFKAQKGENQALRLALKDAELKAEAAEIAQKSSKKIEEVLRSGNANLLQRQLQLSMNEATELKIRAIGVEKSMAYMARNEEQLASEIALHVSLCERLEGDLKRQIGKFNEREMYWTRKLASVLQNTAKLVEADGGKDEQRARKAEAEVEAGNIERSSQVALERQLTEEVSDLRAQNEELSSRLREAEGKEVLGELERRLAEKRVFSQVERQQSSLLTAAQNSIKLLQTVISEKDMELEELNEELGALRTRANSLKAEVSLRNAEIENLKLFAKKSVQPPKDDIRERYEALRAFDERKAEDYQLVLENYKTRISILEAENAQFDELTKELIEKLRVAHGKNEELLMTNKDAEMISTLKTQVLELGNALRDKDSLIGDFEAKVSDLELARTTELRRFEAEKAAEELRLAEDSKGKGEVDSRIKLATKKMQTFKLKQSNALKESDKLKEQLRGAEEQLASVTKQLGYYKELAAKHSRAKTDEAGRKTTTQLNHFKNLGKEEKLN